MIIEKSPLKLRDVNLQQIQFSRNIVGLKKRKTFELNPFQLQVLDQISKGKSISQIMTHFLNNSVMPSFLGLKELLAFLLEEDLLDNPELKNYFFAHEQEPNSFFDDLLEKMMGSPDPVDVRRQVEQLSFFRSLDPILRDIFVRHVRVIETPAEIAICTEGQKQRSLYALLKGQVRVVKNSSAGLRRIAVLDEGSVFGETGYFLGEPRTASVITNEKSVVAKFSYLPELFEKKIDNEVAKTLQKRFWLIHALSKSDIFKELPQDCFDSLLFAGQQVKFSADEFVCIEGQPGNTCYIVIQGQLTVSQKGKSLRVLGQGDCFGEMALILNRGVRTANVQAQTEVLAIEISHDKFYRLMSENLFLGCEFERLALERWQLGYKL